MLAIKKLNNIFLFSYKYFLPNRESSAIPPLSLFLYVFANTTLPGLQV